MDERRRYVRLDTRLEINYTVLRTGKESSTTTESKDISGGGIRIFLKESLPTHTLLKLDILLPEDPPSISCKGEVVWTEEFSVLRGEKKEKSRYEAGIQFTKIDPRDRDRIIKYVILGYDTAKKV